MTQLSLMESLILIWVLLDLDYGNCAAVGTGDVCPCVWFSDYGHLAVAGLAYVFGGHGYLPDSPDRIVWSAQNSGLKNDATIMFSETKNAREKATATTDQNV